MKAKGFGVNFTPAARAMLDLVAAGRDRPIGWLVRSAVDRFLASIPSEELADYRVRFPELAAAVDQAQGVPGSTQQRTSTDEETAESSNHSAKTPQKRGDKG